MKKLRARLKIAKYKMFNVHKVYYFNQKYNLDDLFSITVIPRILSDPKKETVADEF